MRVTSLSWVVVALSATWMWAQAPTDPAALRPDEAGPWVATTSRSTGRTADLRPLTPGLASLTSLSLEVTALQTLDSLHLTTNQLRALQQLARGAADRADRQPGRGPEELRRSLLAFREALLRGHREQAARLEEQVEELLDDDNVDLDDDIELTAAARSGVSEAVKLLSAAQLSAYFQKCADEFEDPLEELLNALAESHSVDQETFEDSRDEVAEDVAFALSGLNVEKEKKISDALTAWLNQVRALSDRDFRLQRAQLERSAKAFVGQVSRQQVFRHYLEHDLAELLANPLLPTAIEARLAARPGH